MTDIIGRTIYLRGSEPCVVDKVAEASIDIHVIRPDGRGYWAGPGSFSPVPLTNAQWVDPGRPNWDWDTINKAGV